MTYWEEERIYICYSDRQMKCSLTGKKIPASQPYLVMDSDSGMYTIQIALDEIYTLLDGIKHLKNTKGGDNGLPITKEENGHGNKQNCIVCGEEPARKSIISIGGHIDPWFHIECMDECIDWLEEIAEANHDKIAATTI